MKKKILCIVLIALLIIGAGVLIAVKNKSSKGEATQEAAFDIEYSDRLDGVPATDTSSNSSSIEVTYGDAGFTRKTLGVADNSDKRSDLKEKSEQAVGEYNVTFLGKNGKIYVAKWTYNSFAYTISINDSRDGVDIDEMIDYIKSTR